MLFGVFYVGDSCQGWGREFESRFPLQILKSPDRKIGAFFIFRLFSQVEIRCLVEYLFLWVFPPSPTSINLLIQKTKITFLNLHP
ncbi:MAG TPA: hypothetical protein DCD99_04550 [Acinetobacter schindleri]|nr:hypothetical protein [Acinetobacter schindleri]